MNLVAPAESDALLALADALALDALPDALEAELDALPEEQPASTNAARANAAANAARYFSFFMGFLPFPFWERSEIGTR